VTATALMLAAMKGALAGVVAGAGEADGVGAGVAIKGGEGPEVGAGGRAGGVGRGGVTGEAGMARAAGAGVGMRIQRVVVGSMVGVWSSSLLEPEGPFNVCRGLTHMYRESRWLVRIMKGLLW
jgi:hypothetical protein